jgi:PCI domain
MASVIIRISKTTPQEELGNILASFNSELASAGIERAEIKDNSKSLDDVITNLPFLLTGQQLDINERFTIIGYLFSDLPEFLKLIRALEDFENPTGSLYALSFLYDIVGSLYYRFRIFWGITKQARKDPNLLTLIQPHLLKIEDFIRSWKLSPSAELTDFILESLELSIPDPVKSRFAVKVLSEPDIKEDVVDKLIGKFISTTEDYEIEKLTALSSFKHASPVVSDLVSLLVTASASEVIAYLSANQSSLAEKGFDSEKVLDICRVSGLVKLATNTQTITFDQVAQRLSVNEDQVDNWIVRAVSNGLIKVKIDAIHKLIHIQQHKLLADKLAALELLDRFEKALSS